MTDVAIPLPGVSTVASITDWENVFSPALVSGVISGLAPTLDTIGRNAVIGTGSAMVRGFWRPVTANTSTAIPAPSGQARIDRLVLRLNRAASTSASFVVPVVIEGSPGANPAEPPLVQTPTGLWDLPVFSWRSAASGALTALTDERYFTGLVLGGVSTARPVVPGPGLLLESDTGMLAAWNGAAWKYLASTGGTWQYPSLAPGGWGMLGGFPALRYQKVAGPQDKVQLEGYLSPGSVKNLTLFSMPAGYYRTDKTVAISATCMNETGDPGTSIAPYITIGTDGSVATNGVPSTCDQLMFNGIYSLDV
jgi:hypothetical protein